MVLPAAKEMVQRAEAGLERPVVGAAGPAPELVVEETRPEMGRRERWGDTLQLREFVPMGMKKY